MSYSLTLFIEKVAFEYFNDYQTMVSEFNSSKEHNSNMTEILYDKNVINQTSLEQIINQDYTNNNNQTDINDDDEENENIVKNVVSSRGKFLNFLLKRKGYRVITTDMNNNDKSLIKANLILSKTFNKTEFKVEEDENKEISHKISTFKKKFFNQYLLLSMLSFHCLFEGFAIGFSNEIGNLISIALLLIIRKLVESLFLGIAFFRSKTQKDVIILHTIIYGLLTPIGVLISILIDDPEKTLNAVFSALISGSFLFTFGNEVIVEEFSFSKNKYFKYFLFVVGGIFSCVLTFVLVLHKLY